jgi:hypothetical protein
MLSPHSTILLLIAEDGPQETAGAPYRSFSTGVEAGFSETAFLTCNWPFLYKVLCNTLFYARTSFRIPWTFGRLKKQKRDRAEERTA